MDALFEKNEPGISFSNLLMQFSHINVDSTRPPGLLYFLRVIFSVNSKASIPHIMHTIKFEI